MATTVAHKESEAELFSLLKSANLLDYYSNFIEQGGDDIHQFCDATEEEFKEMVCLVGMSAKPLHVRRLQKCLVEWKAKKARRGDQTPEKSSSWIDGWTPNQSPNVPRTPTAIVTTPSNVSSRKRKASSGSAGKESTEKRVVELKLPPMDVIIDWEKLDPERQQLIREHSKIYGRDEKKRKSDNLNCHEQMINEAAAQLCLRDPTLLVRRDELFTMARRVVRESGFTYVHGHSRSKFISPGSEELMLDTYGKRPHQSQVNKHKRIERLTEIDNLLQKNKELQEDILRKIEESRTLLNGTEVNSYQAELSKLQNDQVSLQIEQKDLRKKQRRSDRYYSNKEPKDSDSGEGENADGDRQEEVQEGAGVHGSGVEEAFVERSEVQNASHAHTQAMAVQQQQQPAAVVTEILQPASDNTASTTSVTEDESSVRALYSAFMPNQMTNEEHHQAAAAAHAANMASFQAAARGQVQGYAIGTTAITDPTINALLSLSAKDKTMVQGVHNMDGVGMTVPVTATPGTHSTVFSSPNITVVMPTGHTLPSNMQGWR
ncbi:uncharacterized protein LOC116295451 isoform X2 [Actinia tenebrosa]|uniref:Uncharacterized protein LOC116295451 isoform X2 n=1 Tax=Actinia tenebrosa TaxID=6105 RepID=A0A6P8HUY5_ACTTE|nr:uncharacterized protein LOC116295451 isoform X2 [Actinia tenebrosa]